MAEDIKGEASKGSESHSTVMLNEVRSGKNKAAHFLQFLVYKNLYIPHQWFSTRKKASLIQIILWPRILVHM